MHRPVSRRRFVARGAAALGAALGGEWLGAGLGTAAAQAPAQPSSRVAHLSRPDVWEAGLRLSARALLDLVDRGVQHATGAASADKAWQSLFAADDAVAIKVNTSAGPQLSTHQALVDCLEQRLCDVGVNPDSIYVYDRTSDVLLACGYEVNYDGPGVKRGGIGDYWTTDPKRQGAFEGRVANLVNLVSAIINVPILKDSPVGITISLKNHFGTIERPEACHPNGCEPYIADVNALPEIKSRQRLVVCDTLTACFEGGPACDARYTWRDNGVIVGTDPVAVDTVGARIIDAKRTARGLPTLAEVGRPPRMLESAAARGVGTNDLARIEMLEETEA